MLTILNLGVHWTSNIAYNTCVFFFYTRFDYRLNLISLLESRQEKKGCFRVIPFILTFLIPRLGVNSKNSLLDLPNIIVKTYEKGKNHQNIPFIQCPLYGRLAITVNIGDCIFLRN